MALSVSSVGWLVVLSVGRLVDQSVIGVFPKTDNCFKKFIYAKEFMYVYARQAYSLLYKQVHISSSYFLPYLTVPQPNITGSKRPTYAGDVGELKRNQKTDESSVT